MRGGVEVTSPIFVCFDFLEKGRKNGQGEELRGRIREEEKRRKASPSPEVTYSAKERSNDFQYVLKDLEKSLK